MRPHFPKSKGVQNWSLDVVHVSAAQGLGSSATAQKYALGNLNEAKEYLAHPLLGARLIQLTEAFASVENKSAYHILGTPDDLKMKSSMTLFSFCSGEGSVFHQILQKYYNGHPCSHTERICKEKTAFGVI